MGLLDDLRGIENFPPSHVPTINEVLNLVGVLAAYVEHGDELLQAAERDADSREKGEPATAINDLLSPPEPEPSQGATGPSAGDAGRVPPLVDERDGSRGSPAGATDKDDRIAELKRQLAAASDEPDPRDAEIQALEQQIATKRANEQRTQVSVQPGESPKTFGPSASPLSGSSVPTPPAAGPEGR